MQSILKEDIEFPRQLDLAKPPVKQLFYEGEWPSKRGKNKNIFEKSVAIVGSRRMTSYGAQMIERIVPVLVEAGVTIISGFMYGVDQKAHQETVECGGKTVAVLGWGLEYQFQVYSKQFSEITEKGGLVISEWKDEVPLLWMFAYRNRIVAGLAQAVLVIEAAEKSGSLITAGLATDMNKTLLALPGPVTSSVTAGTNGLIKNGQAQMVTSGSEILEIMGWISTEKHEIRSTKFEINSKSEIVKQLENESLSADEMAKKLKRPVEKILAELGMLQLQGRVEESEGRYFLVIR